MSSELEEAGKASCSSALEPVGARASERPEGLSKNQWKKRLKEEWRERMKPEWKRKKKEREKLKRQKRKLEGQIARKHNGPFSTGVKTPPQKRRKQRACPLRIAIDLGYEHLMTDKDVKMLMKQCQRCYATNRRADVPVQLYLTSFGGRCMQRLDGSVQGYQSWDVNFRPGGYIDEFKREDVVYLAAESPNILTELDMTKVYVIGGLVDHNHHKGYCFKAAVDSGVGHAQLPISNFVKLNSRRVLTVNHVFEILLAFLQCNNWEKAFYDVIPQRKLLPQTASVASGRSESVSVASGRSEPASVASGRSESVSVASGRSEPASVASGRSEPSDESENGSNADGVEKLEGGATTSVDGSPTCVTTPSGHPDADSLPSSVEDGQDPESAVAQSTS